MKIIIYGIGEFYRNRKHLLPSDAEIVAFADSNESKATSVSGEKFEDKVVLKPSELNDIDFDYLYICTDFYTSTNIFESLKNTSIVLSKVRFLNRIKVTDAEWQYEVCEDGTILSHIGDVSIHEKKRSDIDTIAEIFAKHTYDIDIIEKSVVIDFGMNVGIASLFFAQNPNVEKVYGFEPFSDTYKMAIDNFNLNSAEIGHKIIPCNAAVIDKEKQIEVAVETDIPGWRSIYVKNESAPKVNIRCLSAAEVVGKIIAENPGKRIIIKCDTEGSEFQIFDSLKDADLIRNIDAIVMEYHRNPKEILEIFRNNGLRSYRSGTNHIGNITAFRI